MYRFDLPPQPLAAPAPVRAPAPASGGGAGQFGALFHQLNGEIAAFIERGSTDAPALSAEGHARRVQASASAEPTAPAAGAALAGGQQAFLATISRAAQEAASRLGVAPEAVAAVAALESGWGQRPIRGEDGGDSNNLFGIKAHAGWAGEVASVLTTEYENGVAVKKTEQFRSYPDQAAAFGDFTRLLLDNPRYRGALGTGGDLRAFAEGLVRGGYASDPDYAAKVVRTATRLQRGD